MKAATFAKKELPIDLKISIHAAREGGDIRQGYAQQIHTLFQSTPPVKAATHFIIPPSKYLQISIHAAREGGDVILANFRVFGINFNPRRP